MREFRTSGSVRDGDGNVPIYSASLLPDPSEMMQEKAVVGETGLGAEEGKLSGPM